MRWTKSHLIRGLLVLTIAIPLVTLAACQTGPSTSENKTPSTGENETPSGGVAGIPEIEITRPREGDRLNTANVTVNVDVSNFDLVEARGQANAQGEGHIHYFMDVVPPTTPGQPATVPDSTKWVMTTNTTYTWVNVTSGNHTFSVELVNNDHTPLNPPVTDNVTITVNVTSNQTATLRLNALQSAPPAKDILSGSDVGGAAAPGSSSTDDPHAG